MTSSIRHGVSSPKYSVAQCILTQTLLTISSGDETLHLMLDIITSTARTACHTLRSMEIVHLNTATSHFACKVAPEHFVQTVEKG